MCVFSLLSHVCVISLLPRVCLSSDCCLMCVCHLTVVSCVYLQGKTSDKMKELAASTRKQSVLSPKEQAQTALQALTRVNSLTSPTSSKSNAGLRRSSAGGNMAHPLSPGSPTSVSAERLPCRPFISSTFKDFKAERDHLVKRIFPQLDDECHARGTYFAPVDLRWGLTKQAADSGQVVKLCLDYVNECRPFFICLLGDRYGWHQPPDGNEDEALTRSMDIAREAGFPWLAEKHLANTSVTEIEILSACLRRIETDPKWPGCRWSYFYIREPPPGIPIPEIAQPENAWCANKVAELKARIKKTGLQVRHFSSPQELGEKVLEDWRRVISSVYGAPKKEGEGTTAESSHSLGHEFTGHEAFAASRKVSPLACFCLL